jgi:hypothetical protein
MLPTSPWKILNIFPYGSNEETILPQSFTFTVTECNKKPSNTKSTRWSRLRGCGAYQRCRSECKHWSIKPRLKDLKGQRGKPLETCHNWQSCWFLRRSCCSAFISRRDFPLAWERINSTGYMHREREIVDQKKKYIYHGLPRLLNLPVEAKTCLLFWQGIFTWEGKTKGRWSRKGNKTSLCRSWLCVKTCCVHNFHQVSVYFFV